MNHHNLTPADQPTDTSSPEPSHTNRGGDPIPNPSETPREAQANQPAPKIPSELCPHHAERHWRWPVLAGIGLGFTGLLLHWLEFAGTLLIPAAISSAAILRVQWGDAGELGRAYTRLAFALTWIAGGTAMAWLIHAGGAPYTLDSLGLLVLWVLAFGSGLALLRTKRKKRLEEITRRREQVRKDLEIHRDSRCKSLDSSAEEVAR